ncbi:FKBP-type peptidyl-prolyl cis-trans isomerase [Nocardioides marinquilinus]|uniref:peptidylprolyl isomerase n=1 Tax=Nocardioides marinquilinus TaxID=1210400 RepID=A0ABP9Q2G3_9ACTN
MLRPRRAAALTVPLLVLSGLLAGCGDDSTAAPGDTGMQFGDRLEAVSIEGEVGDDPELTWKERMEATDVEAETLVEGEGEPLADGDTVFVNFLVANGYTEQTAIDTFGEEKPAIQYEVGAAPTEPASLDDLVLAQLRDQIKAGVTRGSRIVLTGDATAMFGDAAFAAPVAEAGIGNKDGLLVVADVLDTEVLPGPDPDAPREDEPAWAPSIVFDKNGKPTSLDFDGVPEPDGKTLRSAVIKKGSGPEVEKGDLIVVDYLGQTYDGDKPFDESYTKQDLPTPIGLGAVVSGWDKELVGQTVGSRVLLEIPPKEGYGDQASGDIPADSTLYFVVDILAAA